MRRSKKRLWSDGVSLQKDDKYVMKRYGGMPAANGRLFTRKAFDRIAADGNADKPLSELMTLYPAFKAKTK